MALFDVTPSDSVGVSDLLPEVAIVGASSYFLIETDTDSVDLDDVLYTYEVAVSDAIVLEDRLYMEYERSVSDALAVLDGAVTGFEYSRTIATDTLFAVDERIASTHYHRASSDTIDVSDDVDIDVIVSSTDTIDVTDQLLTETDYVRFCDEAAVLTDEVAVDTVFAEDVIDITDELVAGADYLREGSDDVVVTDLILPDKEFGRGGDDTVSVTDAFLLVETVFPIEVLDVTDDLVVEATPDRLVSDAIVITEELERVVDYVRELSDTLDLTDTVAAVRHVNYDVTINDTAIAITDEAAVEPILDRTVQDTIVVTEALVRDVSFVRDGSDVVVVTELLVASTLYSRAGSDALVVTDEAVVEPIKDRQANDTAVLTDSVLREVNYVRELVETPVVSDSLAITLFRLIDVAASDTLDLTDTISAESIDVDVDVEDAISVANDYIQASTEYDRAGSDSIDVTETILAKLGGEVDRDDDDTIDLTDEVGYQLYPGEILDVISIVDTLLIERVTLLPVTLDTDGRGLTITLPEEVRYDRLLENPSFRFDPFPGEGVPFEIESLDPIVTVYQTGDTGEVVYQGSEQYFSPFFRISGSDASSTTSVEDFDVTALEAFSIYDSYEVEVLGASPVTVDSGFNSLDEGGYIEVLNGLAPGLYRIVDVVDDTLVQLDRPLPVVDNQNGRIDWKLTSAVQSLHFNTTKITNQANYYFRVHELLGRSGDPFEYLADFYTSGILGPRVMSASMTDDGYVEVEYDQAMRADRDLVLLTEYTITGPSAVRVNRAWSTSANTVALETVGLQAGSYQLNVNYAGTPKDVAGNPIDPVYSAAIFTGSIPLKVRSIFTDKGPIAKPGLTLQTGFGATIDDIAKVTLPGATLNSSHIGYYVRLGALGLPPASSSSVVGTEVTIIDTVSVPDSLKIELVGDSATTTVYTSLSGTYRVEGILSPTQARVQASFSVNPGSGTLYWELVNPRNGEIADDPSDVRVKVNGFLVEPEAVIGLLGQVVLPFAPAEEDDVKIDYSWVCNPTVEFRRLNSLEFKLNSWNSDVAASASPSQHKYRYNNTLVTPSDYEPLDMLATLDQPENRELHYRAYERAYTPVLNDPTTLLLNSPIHKIAYPPAQRPLAEQFIAYEATLLPENDNSPWVRHGVGAATVSAGVLTVTDNTSGPFPFGQPIFWTREMDLTFPHAYALSWRFLIDSVPMQDGVFSGIAAGYTDENAAYVVGFLLDAGARKIGILKRGSGDNPSILESWIGGIDTSNNSTGEPVEFDWSILHSYRVFRDLNGVIRLFVDGDVIELLRILPDEAPFLEELGAPFDEIQGAFFGSISRPAESVSRWDFVRYLILPTNPLQTSPSSFVSYEAANVPETDAKPWVPIGFHGTETILDGNYLLLDATSATDPTTASEVGLMGGDFKGFVRMEPLLTSASQVNVDVSVQLRTYTHGIDPYGLMFAVDDGTRLTQVAFMSDRSTPKFSYGGRSLPEDFSPYVWTAMGGAAVEMVGRSLQITDTMVGDGKVYFIEDIQLPTSDARVIAAGLDYFLEFRNRVVSYTVDGTGFAGAFGQVFDGTRAVGVMLSIVSGAPVARLHADGVVVATFAFDWDDDLFHTYRLAKSTGGDLVSLFIDGVFIGTAAYSSFGSSSGNAQVTFGSATSTSAGALSVVEWAYCNAWRARSDLKHYVGIWKGYDDDALTGYHLPLKVSGRNATVTGNALGDTQADFFLANVALGDKLIVDAGPNKGVYDVAGVGSSTSLTIVGTWPLGPTVADYRIVKETDWTTLHKYRLTRDSSGEVALLFETETEPLIRVGYNSIDLPSSGVGVVKTVTNGLAAIAWGSFSSENLEQSYWDFVRYGITRTPHELRIAPHHQVMNQWNVMQSPERLYTVLPHELTSFKSSSTGVIPKKDPDFLADPGLTAFTQLNDSTPLVPSTQTFQVRAPFATQTFVSVLNSPEDVLNNDGDFTLNDGTIRYELIVPDDVLYSSLDVIEQSTGEEGLLTPFGDCCGPEFSGFNYTKEVCLTYDGEVLPEDDEEAPTPWSRVSDVPSDVFASVTGGILTYGTFGSKTVYRNNTTLPDAPGLQTEASFRLRLRDDSTLGTGDTLVRFGLSAPGLTCALAFVTSALAERFVIVFDLNNGAMLGSISFDFLDGLFHTYRIVRDPGAGVVRVSIDNDVISSLDIALSTDRPFVTDELQLELNP